MSRPLATATRPAASARADGAARRVTGAALAAAALAPRTLATTAVPIVAVTTLALTAAVAAAPPAAAQTEARMSVRLRPDRPGALAALTVTIRYEDPQAEVPAPLRRAVLQLPESLGIEVPHLRSCSPAALRRHGPKACPPPSRLGGGWAIAAAHAGSQTLSERVQLSAFLGPLVGLQPTFELFAQGVTPFEQRVMLTGTVAAGAPPYGEELVISVPQVTTLPLEPDASIAALSLTIGPRAGAGARGANAVLIPRRCPRAGLPFAVRSSFADGSTTTATAVWPCP